MTWFLLVAFCFIFGIILKKLFELFEGYSIDKQEDDFFNSWVQDIKNGHKSRKSIFTYLDLKKYLKKNDVFEDELRTWLSEDELSKLLHYSASPTYDIPSDISSILIGAVDNADRLREFVKRQHEQQERLRRERYAENIGGLSVSSDPSVGGLSEV